AAGLADRGAIRVGLRADLLRVRLLKETPLPLAVWVKGNRVA
ncbi:MAG: alpha-D-ribose 1-methylphosphonate 5-triphosphate diphosphatase, partial [Alphaproteobacteria bacterium]|nr:alpha-D-ribose 1-methylphosphonate 5-triphosphate diphosphatase [Alphaproteobacteria bacterium]